MTDSSNTQLKNFNSEQQIENKNLLSPIEYRFFVKKLPYTNFFVQKANLPGVSVPDVNIPAPFLRIPHPGDHVIFNELTISFRVDEDLKNWIEVSDWIKASGVISMKDYASLKSKVKVSGEGMFSDFTLSILNSKRNANYNINFIEGFPVSITDLVFDTMNQNDDFLDATATFVYLKYEIERVR